MGEIVAVRLPDCGDMVYIDSEGTESDVVLGQNYDINTGTFKYDAPIACSGDEYDNTWTYYYIMSLGGYSESVTQELAHPSL